MKYKIKYSYQTGDSFGNSDEEAILELEWENIDIAKANLKRIEEHYKYYQAKEKSQEFNASKWYKEECEYVVKVESEKPDWLVIDSNRLLAYHSIKLFTDEGKPWQFWCPWCGYFETLYGAEIIPDESDMKFTL